MDGSELETRLEGIRRGLALLKHRLNPCLLEDEIRAVEAELGLDLPPEYRAFLSRVGNGHARVESIFAADNGVFPLSCSLEVLAREMDLERVPRGHLAAPFEPGMDPDEWRAPFAPPGMLPIFDWGCGAMSLLVVSGSERGNVWGFDNLGDLQPYPRDQEGRSQTGVRWGFLDWLESWVRSMQEWQRRGL